MELPGAGIEYAGGHHRLPPPFSPEILEFVDRHRSLGEVFTPEEVHQAVTIAYDPESCVPQDIPTLDELRHMYNPQPADITGVPPRPGSGAFSASESEIQRMLLRQFVQTTSGSGDEVRQKVSPQFRSLGYLTPTPQEIEEVKRQELISRAFRRPVSDAAGTVPPMPDPGSDHPVFRTSSPSKATVRKRKVNGTAIPCNARIQRIRRATNKFTVEDVTDELMRIAKGPKVRQTTRDYWFNGKRFTEQQVNLLQTKFQKLQPADQTFDNLKALVSNQQNERFTAEDATNELVRILKGPTVDQRSPVITVNGKKFKGAQVYFLQAIFKLFPATNQSSAGLEAFLRKGKPFARLPAQMRRKSYSEV